MFSASCRLSVITIVVGLAFVVFYYDGKMPFSNSHQVAFKK